MKGAITFLADFIPFAASVLDVPPERLSSETACGDIPEWDSVMHLRLVMEAEARYGVSIPLETIPSLRTLADFAKALEALGPDDTAILAAT